MIPSFACETSSDGDNWAVRVASENGHVEVVKVLLQDRRVDPSAKDNWAIRTAFLNGDIKLIKLLIKEKRVKNKLTGDINI